MSRQSQRDALIGCGAAALITALLWLGIVLLLLGCRAPDRFDVGYGHQFQDVGSVKELGLDTGDSDMVHFSVGWNLRPVQVEVIDQPVRSWWPDWHQAMHKEERIALEAEENGVRHAAKTFDAMDWVSKAALLVAACWLGWVYRVQLGRLIPRFSSNQKQE